jgi:hypothetical protein
MGQRRTTRVAAATVLDAAADRQAAVGEAVVGGAATATVAVGRAAVERVGYAPIVRMDETRREIELCATSEAVDSYGTIFDYEASRDAFARWIGNVREMHERKAVGSRVGVRFDDAARKVYVTIRVSRGAQGTWEKVLDGTLRGASIGASNVDWQPRVVSDGGQTRSVHVARRYDLVELSLVDNPSNPDALGYTFVRDAAPDLALLDRLERPDFTAEDGEGAEVTQRDQILNAEVAESTQRPQSMREQRPHVDSTSDTTSSSAPSATSSALSAFTSGPGRLHEVARAVLVGCGCPVCAAAMAALDEVEATGDNSRAEEERGIGLEGMQTRRLSEAALVRALGASLRAGGERLERLDTGMREVQDALREGMREMRNQVGQISGQIAGELASTTGELTRRLERLEAQPMPGGPAARLAEKSHALHARVGETPGRPSAEQQYSALEALAGRIADPQAQIAVAAELIRMQREGYGV